MGGEREMQSKAVYVLHIFAWRIMALVVDSHVDSVQLPDSPYHDLATTEVTECTENNLSDCASTQAAARES